MYRLRQKKGQSILEYLVITTVVIFVILGIRAAIQTTTQQVYDTASTKVGEAGTQLGTFVVGNF